MIAPGRTLASTVSLVWGDVAVAYRPSLQTQHLALFGTMTMLALLLGYWVYRTRRTRGGRLFAGTLFLLGIRTASDVVHGLVGELWTLQTLLVAANPLIELCTLAVFVLFAGRYAGVRSVGSRRAKLALVATVGAAAALVATNPLHGLVFTGFDRVVLPFTRVGAHRGIAGFGLLAVNWALLVVCGGLLAHAFTSGERPAWWSAGVLALGIAQAVLVGGLNLAARGALPAYDYVAVGLGGFVLLSTAALLAHGLRRIEVVAREAILDEIEDPVVVLDRDGRVEDYNGAAKRLFPDVDVGETFADRFEEPTILPVAADSTRSEVTIDRAQRARESGDSRPDPLEARSELRDETDRGGWPKHFLLHATRVTTDASVVLGYAVRFVDVTELERRTRELRRKNDRLDQFAGTVSHDLRNPLTVASGYLDFVKESVESDDEPLDVQGALAHLENVDVSLARMTAIIEDILLLVRSADPVTETETVDLEAIATAAWETADTRRATLEVASSGPIDADRDRLRRLLENLFRNAIDHVGEDVTVEVGTTASGFYVADDGPGVPDEMRDRVFEHGFTTGDGGTGLGLAIVEQLADAHGWTVSLDPDHDGARFVVSGPTPTGEPVVESAAE